jgi:lipopolysaccharide export system protein LptA
MSQRFGSIASNMHHLNLAFFTNAASRSLPTRSYPDQNRSDLIGRQAKLATTLALALTVLATPAYAEKADRSKPLQIEAGSFKHDDITQVSIYTGDVVVTKGTLIMRADKLVLKTDQQGNQFGTATGKLASFRQKREGLDQYMEGYGEQIDYDGKSETVKFSQKAHLRRLEKERLADEVHGSVINYNSKTEVFDVESGAAGLTSQNPSGRVRVVIQPKAADLEGADAPAPKPDPAKTTVPKKPKSKP